MKDTDIASAYTDIWAELDAILALPQRLPSDLDYKQFVARYKCNETTARRIMKSLENSGEWKIIEVSDSNCHNGRIGVIRRVDRE